MSGKPGTLMRASGGAVQRAESPDQRLVSWTVRQGAIERERILKGWTRNQLARAAQIDPKTLRDLLGGRRRPTLGTVGMLARAIDLPLAEVILISERVVSARRPATAPRQELLPLE
jgi:transcriptional regulator with XRE-family HTH domain